MLALGSWDQMLSFYLLSGEQHIKDRKLSYNPCSIIYLNGGSYIAIGGSDCKATLCTKVSLEAFRKIVVETNVFDLTSMYADANANSSNYDLHYVLRLNGAVFYQDFQIWKPASLLISCEKRCAFLQLASRPTFSSDEKSKSSTPLLQLRKE